MFYSSFKLFNLQGSLFYNQRTVMEKRHKKVNLDPKTLTQIKQKSETQKLRPKKNKKLRPKKLRSKNA
jgi:hypothetical protein